MESTSHPYQEILDLLNEQFNRNSFGIAAVSNHGSVHTYSELQAISGKIREFLLHIGVARQHVVGICIEQNFDYLAVLTGVISHGSIFLNLDRYMNRNIFTELLLLRPPDVLIIDQHFPVNLLGDKELNFPIIFIESILCDEIIMAPKFLLTTSQSEFNNDVMYLVYTSGSTGGSNCVMGSYTSLLNRFCWQWQQFPFSPDDILCCQTSPAFTDFLWTSLGGLLVGTPTIFIPKSLVMFIPHFLGILTRHSVTHLTVVPSILRKINKYLASSAKPLSSLKYLVSTGEILYEFIANEFLNFVPNCTLLNFYGSTEIASDVTYHTVHMECSRTAGENQKVSIGRAITGVACYVVDEQCELIKEPYVIGELVVTGVCLSHGYFRNPELTKKRFCPLFLSPNEGAVEGFKTGDLVSWLPNGDLELVGRSDDQVKVAGSRCDLKEIEISLNKIAFLERVIIRAITSPQHDTTLVAYIQLDPKSTPSSQNCPPFWKDISRQKQIHSLIAKLLPPNMVPTVYIFVREFQHLHSGKIDTKSLPDPFVLDWEVEDKLCTQVDNDVIDFVKELFARLLYLEKSSINLRDSFMELGGYSLLVMSLLEDVEASFNVCMPVFEFIEDSSVQNLCEFIQANRVGKQQQQQQQQVNKTFPLVSSTSLPDRIPFSHTQEELYYLHQSAHSQLTYNEFITIQIEGIIEVPLLQTACSDLINTHEILKTTFHLEKQEFYQKIHPELHYKIQILQSTTSNLHREIEENLQHEFKLDQLPLFQLKLIILNDSSHSKTFSKRINGKMILLLSIHHLLVDGLSMCQLIIDLFTIYNTYLDTVSKLPAKMPPQFASFALLERSQDYQNTFKDQLEYWRTQLHTMDTLHIKSDTQGGSKLGPAGQFICEISSDTKRKLTDVSLAHNTSLFTALLAAFAFLLSKYAQDQDDVTIATPMSIRPHVTQSIDLIGPLINVVLIRTKFGLAKPLTQHSFSELLTKMHQTIKEAMYHCLVPLEQVVNDIRNDTNSKSPFEDLLQALFVFHEHTKMLNLLQSDDYTVRGYPYYPELNMQAKSNLVMSVDLMEGGGLQTRLAYRTSLFSKSFVKQFCQDYRQLIQFVSSRPTSLLASFSLLSSEEYRDIVYTSSAPRVHVTTSSIPQLFYQWVLDTPHNIAVEVENQLYTYSHLYHLVSSIAKALTEPPQQHGSVIGICMRQSISLVASILAVLFAGYGYVYLDPDLPTGRLSHITQDANIITILIDSHYEHNAISAKQVTAVINVDILLDSDNSNSLNCQIPPSEICYILYTSGSTGRPKGVIVSQTNVITRCCLTPELVAPARSRFCQVSSFSFDIYVYEFYCSLLNGATLCVYERTKYLAQLDLFTSLLHRQYIDCMMLAPPLCDVISKAYPRAFSSLYSLMVSGDILQPIVSNRILTQGAPKYFYNMHGITETTVVDSKFRISELFYDDIPIGRPLTNNCIFVVDKHMNLLPKGIVGEVLVGGATVALGYLNNSEKTAEKFKTFRFNHDSATRMFKSGDLGYLDFSGNFRFIGRSDWQIKLRGQRLELGEIERRAIECPGVNEFAAVCKMDSNVPVSLLGFCSTDLDQFEKLRQDLTQHFRDTLAPYMVPSELYFLKELPWGPTGKIDRLKLLKWIEEEEIPNESPHAKCSTVSKDNFDTKTSILSTFQNYFPEIEISVSTDFFNIGGNSIVALQMVSEINAELQISLSLREFFQYSSVAKLVKFINEKYNIKVVEGENGNVSGDFSKQEISKKILQTFPIISETKLDVLLQNRDFFSQIINCISKLFGLKIDPKDLQNTSSLDGLCSLIVQQLNFQETTPSENIEFYPLAATQRQFALAHLLHPTESTYRIPFCIYSNQLKWDNVKEFFSAFIQNHSILRTVYNLSNELSQKLLPNPNLPIKHIRLTISADYTGDPLEYIKLKEIIENEVNNLLDINISIPIQVTLVDIYSEKFPQNKSLIIVNLHHIAADGWSVNLLLEEFQNFIQNYPKYSLKSTNFLELTANNDEETFLTFWRDNLSKFTCNELSPFMLSPLESENSLKMPDTYKNVLEIDFAKKIQKASQDCSVTPFMLLLSAFVYLFTFLFEPSLQLVILTPVSTRSTLINKQHFGPSVNLLPLAIDLESKELCKNFSFKHLCRYIHNIFLSALENSPISLEQIKPFLKPNSSGENTLPAVFSYDTDQIQTSLDLGKCGKARVLPAYEYLPNILQDVLFEVNYTGVLVEESLTISEARIRPDRSRNIIHQYNLLLESVCDSLDTPLSKITTLPDTYLECLKGVVCPSEYSDVVSLVYKVCSDNSDRILFEFEDGDITYKQFFTECYAYAETLHDKVNNNTIAIILDLSIELVIAMISTLISGNSYILIDPILPIKRIQAMLKATHTTCVVTTNKYRNLCKQVTTESVFISVIERTRLKSETFPQDYKFELTNETVSLMSTSGSTGEPKYVKIPHSSIISRIHTRSIPFYLPNETVLICSSLSFDILPLQIFGTIFSATKGIILHQNCLGLNLEKLKTTILDRKITQLTFPTPVLHIIIENMPEVFKHVNHVDFGGDVASPDVIHKLKRLYPDLILTNSYGPTEATIVCAIAVLTEEDCARPILTIGSSVPNTQLIIVDEHLRCVPHGLPGELLVTGAIMSGYMNRSDDETLVEIENACGDVSMYFRTGDRVQQREDGNLEFLGRNDFQVKIDGQRVELCEIEHVLMSHQSVQIAIVFVKTREKSKVKVLVACILCQDSVTRVAMEEHAREHLTPVMVPSEFYFFKKFPLSINGKVDRAKLFENIQVESSPVKSETIITNSFVSQNLLEDICTCWKQVLGLEEIPLTQPFHTLGGTSLLLVQLHYKLQQKFSVNLSLPEILTNNTVWLQSNWLASKSDRDITTDIPIQKLDSPKKEREDVKYPLLAVVGMACRFPMSENKESFHDTLLQGKDCIQKKKAEEGYLAAGGCVSDVELFDSDYFNISTLDASLMDPQYRLVLELAVDAIRDSAISLDRETVGVFIGCAANTYLSASGTDLSSYLQDPALSFHAERVQSEETAANFISYHLNLTGPSLLVKTTCVSSLTALHLAAHSLHTGECTAAIVGGVDVTFPQITPVRQQQDMIFSPTGHCKSFDETADGLVSGNGLGLLVITPLHNALTNGYPIYCNVAASYMNNDGNNKDTYFTPSLYSLTSCIKHCVELTTHDYIGCIEAHGAGTCVGDQIELEALHRVYSLYGNSINLGSVKSNIGHLGYASGVAALCKSVLQLERSVLYPSLHFKSWNRSYVENHDHIPFRVARKVEPWAGKKRSAVNGMGQGGTNVHIILEEHVHVPTVRNDVMRSDNGVVCPLAAHSENALRRVCSELIGLIERQSNMTLESLVSSLYNVTGELRYRKCFISPNLFDLLSQLKQWESVQQTASHSINSLPSNLVLIFPGQGAHFSNMGLSLYLDSRTFRSYFDECVSICRSKLNFDLYDLLFVTKTSIDSTQLQVYTVCLQVCLYRLITSLGVTPAVAIGHSIGEISVAICYGVFSLEDGLEIVYNRSQLMLECTDTKHGMLAIKTGKVPAEEFATRFGLSIAAFNSPNQTVLSGEKSKIDSLYSELQLQNIQYKVLSVPTAYHSNLLTKVLPQYRDLLHRYKLHTPSKQYISTVTGSWVDVHTVCSVSYWEDQMVNPVLFYAALECSTQLANPVYLEIGPGNRLSSIVRNHMPRYATFQSLITSDGNYLDAFKEIWEFGCNLKWSLFRFYEDDTPKIRIFPFPFERKKYTLENTKHIFKPTDKQTTFQTPTLVTKTIPENAMKTIDHQLSQSLLQLIQNVSDRILEGEHENLNITLGLGLPGGTTIFHSLTNLPTSSTTIYPIGCLSSIFIYILFNIFLATGSVTHDTNLIDLLPFEYSISEKKASITLFQLATHSSGLPFLPSRLKWEVADLSSYSLNDLFTDFFSTDLQSEPGTEYSYSVFGSALLSHALSAITEQSYEELIHSHILQPLQLKSTFITASMRTLKFKHYQGYDVTGGKVAGWRCGEAFKFADGIHSNLEDLVSLTQYLTGIKTCEIPMKNVLDFMIKSDQNAYSFLTGITNGSSVWLAVDVEWKTSIIIACNTSLDNCKKLAKLNEFAFNSIPGLYTSLYNSAITNGVQSIPMSFGEKQITALGGGTIPVAQAPIAALADCWEGQDPKCVAVVEKTVDEVLENDLTEIEKVILGILTALLGADVMKSRDVLNLEFSQLGLDSLLAISLAEQVSNVFNKKISFHLLSEYTTVNKLSTFIRSDMDTFSTHIPFVRSNGNVATKSIPNTKIYELFSHSEFPLVIEPSKEELNGLGDLKRIFSKHYQTFQSLLLSSGALLFRNFKLDTAEHFAEFTNELSQVFGPSLEYLDGISPRTRVIEKIYTSTEYPSKYNMSPHNEMSYSPLPPSHIMFFCLTPPAAGCRGQTPLMNSRDILEKIPDGLLREWKDKGLRYFWNLPSRGKGVGKSWEDTYRTEDKECVEKFLREQEFQFEWRSDMLRTSRTASITRQHPITKEEVWFNHALLFHPSELPDHIKTSLASFPKEEFPKHCIHGNGDEIPDAEIAQIKSVCLSNLVEFDWQKGDVLLVDNYLVAHARNSFTGERKILVSMFRCQD